MATKGTFRHIDPTTCADSEEPFVKPWVKVDDTGRAYKYKTVERDVINARGKESELGTDVTGFEVFEYPSKEKLFVDDAAVRGGYYDEVEQLLRDKLPGVKKVVIFDHTIRRKKAGFARQPVQDVHVDQTTGASIARVRRHLPEKEAEDLLKGRFQIINVWRPIEYNASDSPLAVIDWRTTEPKDFVKVDLLYPVRAPEDDDDDRGKESVGQVNDDTTGYEVRGETMGIAPNEKHKFYYYKDMTPDEAMFIKCFDSRADGFHDGVAGRARCTPHTAFNDPQTPADAPGRQSIEVRCLVFYH